MLIFLVLFIAVAAAGLWVYWHKTAAAATPVARNGNGFMPPRAGYRFASDALRPKPRGPQIVPKRFTGEPVDRLGVLAAPCWSHRARHVGVVSKITPPAKRGKPALARLTYVNRSGGARLPLRDLRVVVAN